MDYSALAPNSDLRISQIRTLKKIRVRISLIISELGPRSDGNKVF